MPWRWRDVVARHCHFAIAFIHRIATPNSSHLCLIAWCNIAGDLRRAASHQNMPIIHRRSDIIAIYSHCHWLELAFPFIFDRWKIAVPFRLVFFLEPEAIYSFDASSIAWLATDSSILNTKCSFNFIISDCCALLLLRHWYGYHVWFHFK
jgi:hypothetical protein